MPMFPVPAFVAAILAYLALRTLLSGGRPLLIALLCAAAWQSLAVALVIGYGVDFLRPVLPVTATAIPALAWVTFRSGFFTQREPAVIHAVAPGFTLFCSLFAPATLDAVVSGIFAIYGVAILIALRRSIDMPLARLEAGDLPARLWKALGWALILSALTDTAIAAVFIFGREDWAGWIVTVFSSAALLALGVLSASPSAAGNDSEDHDGQSTPPRDPEDLSEDAVIMQRLDALLERERLHLDPDLTLSRLARRLHVPEKRLSAAVNRATRSNVSRHINGWRIRHACHLLDVGHSVTNAMLESGFNTKSNFNREFQRIVGRSPTAYLKGAARREDGDTGSDDGSAPFAVSHKPST